MHYLYYCKTVKMIRTSCLLNSNIMIFKRYCCVCTTREYCTLTFG